MRIAINGFGRIGRMVLRSYLESYRPDLTIVALNDLGSLESNLHLLKYDSVHGQCHHPISVQGSTIDAGYGPIMVLSQPDPVALPWKELGVDLVFECSGRFTKKETAAQHLQAGAKQVLVSAPCDQADLTVVYGVNHRQLNRSIPVISNASCTTNCLAPVAFVLDQAFGIEMGSMTTIHSYTGDQRIVDTLHSDLRRARAAACSMIPTSTGAAKAVGLVLPHLKGKLDGTAIRVPTPNVSVVDFQFLASQPITVESVNQALESASQNQLRSILSTSQEPLVSCDFNHHSASSIVDLPQTQVIQNRLGRVLAWYDNEWGFANRMLDVACYLGGLS